jgi:hypothetical protein
MKSEEGRVGGGEDLREKDDSLLSFGQSRGSVTRVVR